MCAAHGIEAPEGQVDLGTRDRWIGRVDFVWRRAKLIVEIDGSQHRAPLDRRSDRDRDGALGGEGWTIMRFTWWQLVHESEAVIARLRAHLSFSW
jgi:very-short-patch-repair endonuclease